MSHVEECVVVDKLCEQYNPGRADGVLVALPLHRAVLLPLVTVGHNRSSVTLNADAEAVPSKENGKMLTWAFQCHIHVDYSLSV
jgi:hypothetical protein